MHRCVNLKEIFRPSLLKKDDWPKNDMLWIKDGRVDSEDGQDRFIYHVRRIHALLDPFSPTSKLSGLTN